MTSVSKQQKRDEKQHRLAQQLRDNLKKRKSQARERKENKK